MASKHTSPRWLRIVKWVTGILLGLIVILWIIFRFALGEFGAVDEATFEAYYDDMPIKPTDHMYEVGGVKMHYKSVGAENLPTILFIHGSPGSWDAFASYMQDPRLLDQARMISVDRMGYGKSAHIPESSLEKQVDYIWPVVETLPDSVPLILVGHSYGGPVAVRMAMDYPDRVDGMVILAGLADPEYEKRLAIQSYLRSPYLRWLLPPALDISNREIVPLKEELKDMLPLWERISASSLIIQGTGDILVAYPHATFAHKMLSQTAPSLTMMEGENHFFIWSEAEMVIGRLLEFVQCVVQEKA
ncbi:MAG: alpha/beta hydrolase [Bacteroidota bacterium]